jgi:hypothetical protein
LRAQVKFTRGVEQPIHIADVLNQSISLTHLKVISLIHQLYQLGSNTKILNFSVTLVNVAFDTVLERDRFAFSYERVSTVIGAASWSFGAHLSFFPILFSLPGNFVFPHVIENGDKLVNIITALKLCFFIEIDFCFLTCNVYLMDAVMMSC